MAQPSSRICCVIGRKPLRKYVGVIKRNCETGEEYAAFFSIPYAKVPEGLDRYQPPEPATSESDSANSIPVYHAYHVTKKFSTQIFTSRQPRPRIIGSTDCLYLNIFTPRNPEKIKELQPVFVFIPGGGFSCGSNDPDQYTPDSIIKHGLVFVSINYRLGVNGFLNLHSEDIPGNVGLKDQVLALEWIRDNIESFNGDPNNVTLCGWSAGGTCVNLHLISPMSKNLFHRAIIQSGGLYAPWGYRGRRREQKKVIMSDKKCVDMLYEQEDCEDLHFRVKDLFDLDRLKRHPQSLTPLFGPSTETYINGRAFLPDLLKNMIQNVKHEIPIMAGICREEGLHLIFMSEGADDLRSVLEDGDFRQLLMDSLRWDYATADEFFNKIRDRYFPGRLTMSEVDIQRNFAKLARDLFFRRFYDCFKFGPEKSIENLFVYRFDHFSELSFCSSKDLLSKFRGEPTHGDELKYLFCPTYTRRHYAEYINEGENQNKEIKQVMDHICSLWANFCKTGVPSSDFDDNLIWRPHTDKESYFLSIDKDLVLHEGPLYKEEWKWLNDIINKQPTVESLPPTPN